MLQLSLDDRQAEILRDVLDGAFRDLRAEIADTDNAQYKRGLREQEDLLRVLLDQLGGPIPR